jgi:hypothetical protein
MTTVEKVGLISYTSHSITSERNDVGYLGSPTGYPGFTKPYANPITGTTRTFSGRATATEIELNGGGGLDL